jgi:hypothetical protein
VVLDSKHIVSGAGKFPTVVSAITFNDFLDAEVYFLMKLHLGKHSSCTRNFSPLGDSFCLWERDLLLLWVHQNDAQ